jgi:hypothetical protein
VIQSKLTAGALEASPNVAETIESRRTSARMASLPGGTAAILGNSGPIGQSIFGRPDREIGKKT